MFISETHIVLGVLVILSILFVVFHAYHRQTPTIIVVEHEQKEDSPASALPYWTAYGQPTYWPVYLSPYWMYDVPFYGPITSGGGYRRSHGYRPGYSGVASGGS